MKRKIIAVVGMCGSGKSVATDEFVKRGWLKVYFGKVTFDIMKDRGLAVNEQNERLVREELRATGDKGIYAKLCAPAIETALKKGNVVVESMYSWSEYKYLKEKFGNDFEVLSIVTDAKLRRERLMNRKVRPLSFEVSQSRDYAEIENIEKGGPIVIADHFITNNADEKSFVKEVNEYIDVLLNKKEEKNMAAPKKAKKAAAPAKKPAGKK